MNGQRIEQQTEEVPFEAVSLTCEVSDEALEAVGGKTGGLLDTLFGGWNCPPLTAIPDCR